MKSVVKKTEANRLNARIDRLIAEEIEARKLPEEVDREAEARGKAQVKYFQRWKQKEESDSRKSKFKS